MRSFTIGKKLTLSVSVMVLVVLVLSYFSLRAVNSLEATYTTAVDRTFRRAMLADQMNTFKSDIMLGQRGMVFFTLLKKPEAAEEGRRLYHSNVDLLSKALAEVRPLLVREEGRQLTAKMDSGLTAWREVLSEEERLCGHGEAAAASVLSLEKGAPIYRALGEDASRLNAIQVGLLKEDQAAATGLGAQSRWIITFLIVLCLATGAGTMFVVRQINRTLQGVATELGEGAGQVASAAGEISSASQSLSQGASEQAATLEETSASSEEISSMIQKNAGTSREVAQNMLDAARQIEVANRSLELMVVSMQEINASSGKIAKIIKVIDEIAFQTNLLALNAAVEAARAGEAGMGFAVVAEEVRSLAQRCAQAAKDTENLIEESIHKSQDGKLKLEQVTAAVASVTESASKVKVLVDELDLASQEQAKGMQQVTSAIVVMEQVTQRNAASAEESASAGEELSAQSMTLREMVDRLSKLVGSGT